MNTLRSIPSPVRIALIVAASAAVFLFAGCSESPTGPAAGPGDDFRIPDKLAPFSAPTPAVSLAANPMDFGDGHVARTACRNGVIVSILTDAAGAEVARSTYSFADRTLRFETADAAPMVVGDFDAPNANTYGANVSLYYYYRNVRFALDADAGKTDIAAKAPGCDFIPDFLETKCMLACCAAHDQCWADHGCGYLSWLGFDGLDCFMCNASVVACMYNCIPPLVRPLVTQIAIQALLY